MNCPTPKCNRRLRVTNVISTGAGKTQAAECSRCKRRFTFLTVLVGEIKERGDGPHAIAQRLKAGVDPIEILNE